MRFTHLRLENWRNFKQGDVPLQRRAFVVGPNASGKSNLLDAFRFLRDLAEPEGTFQHAVQQRGGVSQIRCLHARRQPNVTIDVEIELGETAWRYRLEFGQDPQRRPLVRKEIVWKNGQEILQRPREADQHDPKRLTQTHLEQINANMEFRDIADFLAKIRYLHVVPQIVRDSDRSHHGRRRDPYGGDFLEQIATTAKRTRESRLKKINKALQVAVPQLKELKLERDDVGVPHLKGLYEHWRPKAGWQSEEHFSDGTLRLLGLLWAFLDGDAPLLLEEPELSLHAGVVRYVPAMMAQAGRRQKVARQVLISTHSPEMLSDESIAPEEVILLEPSREGTQVRLAAEDEEMRLLLQEGLTAAEVAMSRTAPKDATQLALFGT